MSVPEAARSISDFLSSLNIAPEEVEVALRVFTASGYGFPGQTPAVYFHQFLQIFLGEPPRLKSGYQNLMELMAANLRSVRCGVRVQEVVRRPGSAPKVVFEGGWEEEFDKVIVTGGAWLAAGLPQGMFYHFDADAVRSAFNQPGNRFLLFCGSIEVYYQKIM